MEVGEYERLSVQSTNSSKTRKKIPEFFEPKFILVHTWYSVVVEKGGVGVS